MCLRRYLHILLFLTSSLTLTSAKLGSFPVVMPRVKPDLPKKESYLCTSVLVDQSRPFHVRKIRPLVDVTAHNVHHMILTTCSDPVHGGHTNGKNLWNCGGSLGEEGLAFAPVCREGSEQVGVKKGKVQKHL